MACWCQNDWLRKPLHSESQCLLLCAFCRSCSSWLSGTEIHQVHFRWAVHQHQSAEGAGVRWWMPPFATASQLDWRRLWNQVLEQAELAGVEMCQWQNSHPEDPASVSGWKYKNLQNNCGHSLQVQAIHQAAQWVQPQLWGNLSSKTYPAPQREEKSQ